MGQRRLRGAKAALLGVLGAQALALSYCESLLPALPFLPPMAKPGLSNILTMFAAGLYGFPSALYITLLKALFAALTRGVIAGGMSLAGGLCSTALLCLLLRLRRNPFGWAGLSVLCALAHNAGQLCMAVLLGGAGLWGMAAPLILLSVVTGLLTGFLLRAVQPALEKQTRYFLRHPGQSITAACDQTRKREKEMKEYGYPPKE